MDDLRRNVNLQHYLPPVVADSKEFQELNSSEDAEFSTQWNALWQWFQNTFVYDFDETGLERWENMLSIIPKSTYSFETRRLNILSRMSLTPPYTWIVFQNMLRTMFKNAEIIAFRNISDQSLWLKVTTNDTSLYNQILVFARAIIPADMGINVYYGYSWNGAIKYDGTYKFDSANLEG